MNVGDYVVDREAEDDDPPRAIVVLTPDMTIEDWEVDDETTVADMNPEYDTDAPIAIVAYEEDLDDWWEGWRYVERDELFDEITDRGHKFYAFPQPRLEVVEEGDGPEEKDALQLIREALEDAGYEDVERVDDDTLVLEKFGEYTIRPDGTVEGSGTIRDQLVRLVDSAAPASADSG